MLLPAFPFDELIVRGRDLAVPYAVISGGAPAIDAARLLAREETDVVLVHDEDGTVNALDNLALLRFLLPDYVVSDRALARVMGDDASQLLSRLDGRTTGDLVARDRDALPRVSAEAHLVEIASVMVGDGAGLVAVLDDDQVIGGITTSALLTALLGRR